MKLEVLQRIVPKIITNVRPGYLMVPKFVTVHNTGNVKKGANALLHARYLENGAGHRYAGWHATTDDKRVVQHLPYSESGWHCGDGANGIGNRQSLGVEICMNQDGNYKKAEEHGVLVVAMWMKEFNIPLSNVRTHQSWSGKYCPSVILREGRWNSFLQRVKTVYDDLIDTELMTGWNGQILRLTKPLTRGTAVVGLQEGLIELGQKIVADGVFGPATEKAVKNVQRLLGLKPDGIAGQLTYEAMEVALTPKEDIKVPERGEDVSLHRVRVDGKQVGAFSKTESIIKTVETHLETSNLIEVERVKNE